MVDLSYSEQPKIKSFYMPENHMLFSLILSFHHTTNLCQQEWQITERKNVQIKAVRAINILWRLSFNNERSHPLG